MSFHHGKVELKNTRNCFVSLPSKWNLTNFQANHYGIIVVKVIFLDDIKCDKYIYVTWNGSRNRHDDYVTFDRLFASSLGLQSDESILVQAVKSPLIECIQCHLIPRAENDYQLIQLNANEIECELLHQIRVITTAFLKDNNESNQFNVFPIWIKSLPNVPIYVKISLVEPLNKNGLILTDSTKLVIHSLLEDPVRPTSVYDTKRGRIDENSPNTLKSVFGIFRSMLPKSLDGVSQGQEVNSAPLVQNDVPLYRGRPLLLRVLPSTKSRACTLNCCTVFISSKHFANLEKHGVDKKYCLLRMRKLKSGEEKPESKVPASNSCDVSAMSHEEKTNFMFVEKLLNTFDTRNEFLVIAFAIEDLPVDVIMMNELLRKQHTITATSYVHLQEIEPKRSGLPIVWCDGIAQLTIPVLRHLTLFPVVLDQSDVSGDSALKHHLNLLMPSPGHILNDAIFLGNGFILTLGKSHFITSHSEVNANIEKSDFTKLLLSSFYAISADTELVVKRIPIKCDISNLLLKLSQDVKSLDNTHLQICESTLLNRFRVFDTLFEKCINFIKISLELLNNNSKYSSFSHGSQVSDLHSSILIVGPKGSGKTSLVKRIELELINNHDVFCQTIQCALLKGKRIESLHKSWSGIFEEAMQRQPSLVVLEGLDEIAYDVPDEKQASGELDTTGNVSLETIYCTRVAYVFCHLVDSLRKFKLSSLHSRVAIVATANSSLHSLISQLCLFDQVIELQSPDSTQRALILQEMLTKKGLSLDQQTQHGVSIQFNLNRLARTTKGFMLKDLNTLVDLAVHKAMVRELENQNLIDNFAAESLSILNQDVEFALSQHSSKQIQKLNSTLRLTDVGGMDKVKEIVLNTVLLPTRFSNIFARLPLKSQNSILLYGMPGTGKTMLVEAVSNESGLNFIGVKGPELLSKYIGASEQAVRHLFERAQSVAPCILFFDEFDSLAPRRGHDSTGVTDRIVNQMLTLLDGLETMRRDVYVLAATSRPDLIDLALLRPGRFDHCVRCSLPTESERGEILISLARKLTIDIESFPLNQVVQSTANFSGADLQALMYNAYLSATKRSVLNPPGDGGVEVVAQRTISLEREDMKKALGSTKPSLDDRERLRFTSIYDKFEEELSGRVVANSQPKTLTLA